MYKVKVGTLNLFTKKKIVRESLGHFYHGELTGTYPLICYTQSDRTTPQSVKLEFIIRGLWGIQGSDQYGSHTFSCHRTMKDKSHMFRKLCKKKRSMFNEIFHVFCSCLCIFKNITKTLRQRKSDIDAKSNSQKCTQESFNAFNFECPECFTEFTQMLNDINLQAHKFE